MYLKLYLLNLIVISLINLNCGGQYENKTLDNSNKNDMFWINRLAIFNEHKMWINWSQNRFNLTVQCNNDMENYLNSLENQIAWAIRMKDASGQYNGGLFWGNDHWLGSASLCRKLDDGNKNYQIILNETEPLEDPEFIITFEKRTLYKSDPYAKFTRPPFRLMFSTILFRMNISDAQNRGIFFITQGLCLPRSCTQTDIRKIFTFGVNLNNKQIGRDVNVIKIRQLNGHYSIWTDKMFHIVSSITIIVILFVVIGTIIDMRSNCKKSNGSTPTITINDHQSEMEANNNQQQCSNNITKYKINELYNIKINMIANLKTINSTKIEILKRIFLSFSLKTNVKKICSADIGNDTLAPIHGLRLFSFMWVVMVHTCLIVFQMSDNKKFRNELENDVLYQTISNATFSVDTFFFISGVLVSFLFYRTMAKYKSKKGAMHTHGIKAQIFIYFSMILYRFVRLTPPYLFVIGLSSISTKHHLSNSVIQLPSLDHVNCEKYWWRNIFYINTFFPSQQMCMIWSWYLANDSQFYVIGVLVLLLSVEHKKFAGLAIAILLIIAWITTATITIKTGYIPSIADPFSHYDELYDKPWTRFGPYFVGILTGYILHTNNCKLSLNKWLSTLCWIASAVIIFITVYGLYYITFDIYTAAAYVSLSHTFWAVAIAWILYACVSGSGGWVTKFLSWRYIYPFSRLAYCAYLIHPVIIKNVLLNVESPLHLTREVVTIYFLGFLVASFFIALLISLLFEAPIVALLHFTHPIKPDKVQEVHENQGFETKE